MNHPDCYDENNSLQMRDTKKFVCTIKQMDWSNEDQDFVMDIGTGTGSNLRKVLLPMFPSVRKVIAIDVSPSMIEFAKKKNKHEKIEYYVADFADRSSIKRWEQQISKAVSVYCIQWIKNQRTAFENLFYVLKPGGEAALILDLSATMYDACQRILLSPKWRKLLQNVDPGIPSSHFTGDGEDYYRAMLGDVGFEIVSVEAKDMSYSHPDDETYPDFYFSISCLSKYIPEELKEEFKKDYFETNVSLYRQESDGRLVFQYRSLFLFLRKPT